MRNEVLSLGNELVLLLSGRKKDLHCKRLVVFQHQQKNVANTPTLREKEHHSIALTIVQPLLKVTKKRRNDPVLREVAPFIHAMLSATA